ncbi:S41 family peptidase, partial [Paenibacillus ihuae]|uniref:S41 family peptidase n=1 Tax=Paenibacillus ihuae TaxID=1232431 RepID=UPI0011DDB914
MKSAKVITAVLSGCLALSVMFSPAALAADSTQTSSNTDLINEIMQYLESYNVEGVDHDTLIRGAIDGMVNTLEDPYSTYFTKEEAAEFESMVDLEYVGIGVRLVYTPVTKELYIEEVIAGSPAEQAGLKRGDTILKINGVAVSDTAGDELAGTAGTKVSLLISRNGASKTISVTRNDITSASVTGQIIGDHTAYITITGFSQSADEEFSKVLDSMRAAGMNSLVLDLRDNTGGYMDSAYNI